MQSPVKATRPGVHFAPQAHAELRRGMNCLADLLRPTLGPTPRFVAVERSDRKRTPEILDDGATILRRMIQLPDPHQNMGAMLMRHTLWQVHKAIGDGTSTTAVLMQSIINQSARYLAVGGDVMSFTRGLQQGLSTALAALNQQAQSLDGKARLARMAEAACLDAEMAALLGEIFDIVGADGYVQVRKGNGLGLERQYVEGVHWYAGYFSAHFATDLRKQEARLENSAILISDLRLLTAEELVPLLERIANSKQRSLLIIAQQVSGSALGLLVANHKAGKLKLLAVKPPSHGSNQAGILEDLAVLTGGRVVTRASGERAQDVTLADLGYARRAWANASSFGVLGGRGDPLRLRQRILQIKAELAAVRAPADRENLRERLGKLHGGIAILQVGAASEAELEARKTRAERAVDILRLALAGGVVPGGGAAYLACQPALQNLSARFEADEKFAIKVLAQALEEPLRVIASNAGHDPSLAVNRVRSHPPGWGFDARIGQAVDMWAAGILDPTPVLRTALQAAVSGAAMALTTEVLVLARQPKMTFEP